MEMCKVDRYVYPKPTFQMIWVYWTLAIGESCLHEILAFSLDSFLNGRLENATI
jgi:hypothetical protein